MKRACLLNTNKNENLACEFHPVLITNYFRRNTRKLISYLYLVALLAFFCSSGYGQSIPKGCGSTGGIVVSTTDAGQCDNAGTATLVSILGGEIFIVGPYGRYSVIWPNAKDVRTTTNLKSGGYSVTVIDNVTKCQGTKSFTIKKPPSTLQAFLTGDGSKITFCNTQTPPTIILNAGAIGGCPFSTGDLYTFSPGREIKVSGSGSYTVTVKDAAKNSASATSCVVYIPVRCSRDPNEMVGPIGYGEKKFVSKTSLMEYTIRYENDPVFATSSASKVSINLPVSSNVGMTSFRLKNFGFGNYVFEVPANTAIYSKRLDLRDSLGIYLDVVAGIDLSKKKAFWVFQSIDPKTGLPPTDPTKGYLPVNNKSIHNGEGFATFTWKPNSNASTGDTIYAQSEIVFDLNEPILTNSVFNTIDAKPPTSIVEMLSAQSDSTLIDLKFSGTDDSGGSGISSYQLFASENGGPYEKVGEYDTTIASFTGQTGKYYGFYTKAIDHTGNTESPKKTFDTYTVIGKALRPSISLKDTVFCVGDSMMLRATSNKSWKYEWYLDDQRIAYENDSLIYAKAAGHYNVFVSDEDNNMGYSKVVKISLIEITPPVPDLAELPDIESACPLSTLTLPTAKSNCGCQITVTNNAIFPITSRDTSVVIWTYSDGKGHFTTQPQNVVINDHTKPIVMIRDLTVKLDSAGKAGITASQVDNGSSDNCGIASMSVSPDNFTCANGGDNMVTLTVTDASGNIATATATVKVTGLPEVSFTGLSSQYCINADTAILTGTPLGGTFSGDGVTGNSFKPSLAGVGTHQITYSYTDYRGCSASQTQSVTINSLPVVNFKNSNSGLCLGGTLSLDAGKGFKNYAWTTGATSQTITVNKEGWYAVTVTNENDCKGNDSIWITVFKTPVSLGKDTSLKTAESIVLIPQPREYQSYLWNDNSTGDTLLIQGKKTGTGNHLFWVKVTDSHNCSNTDTVNVMVSPSDYISLMNADNTAIYLYPNPTDGLLNLNIENLLTADLTIELFNVNGVSALFKGYHSSSKIIKDQLDLSRLAAGSYILRIKYQDLVEFRTIIKK